MHNSSIVVADSSETSRKNIYDLLSSKGYKVYQATDGAGTLRLARTIRPDLVIIDTNIWGLKAYDIANIIESDDLSTVLFITKSPDKVFYENLKKMKLFAYINKPIIPIQLHQTVEFSLMNSKKINVLSKKVKKLESTLESRKKIDKAKGIIMEKLNYTENEAFKYLRKKSMDNCDSMEKVADSIIKKYT